MDNKTRVMEAEKAKRSAGLRVLWLLVLSAMAMPSLGQAVERWSIAYWTVHRDVAYDVCTTSSGGYMMFGTARDYRLGITKVDSAGGVVWRTEYLPAADQMLTGHSGLINPDGSIIVAGDLDSAMTNQTRVYILKTDSVGDSLWARQYSADTSHVAHAARIIRTCDGGYALACQQSYSTIEERPYVIRTDSQGETLWTRTYGTGPGCLIWPTDIRQTRDGGFIIAGVTDVSEVLTAAFLMRIDGQGDSLWFHRFGLSDDNEFQALDTCPDGGFLAAGYADSLDSSGYDDRAWMLKADSSGDSIWAFTYTYGQHHICVDGLCRTPDGGAALAGLATMDTSTQYEVYVAKTTALGELIWTRIVRDPQYDSYAKAITATRDGGLAIAGHMERSYSCHTAMYLIKTDSSGSDAAIQETPPVAGRRREQPELEASSSGEIRYFLPLSGCLDLGVYNSAGRRCGILSSGQAGSGWHATRLPPEMPSGAYFVRLTFSDASQSCKVVLIR